MSEGKILAIYGTGQGKSAAAIGKAIATAEMGENVVVIQFLKGLYSEEYLNRLEPEIRFFRFERSEKAFSDLTGHEQKEEEVNIRNGLFFARKVLTTDECKMLILDEVLGIVSEGLITEEELIGLFKAKNSEQEIILTGTNLTESVRNACDVVMNISKEK
ncbi:MAG: cob(I)yrinic acid a,c-diamide adenosyltransferase [Lachnospiraceae bacterium]|nr:cob(I)yrinic acid a,c-diamide adenosyltransferase [Lachnospiraceae bacterium]